MTIVVIRSVDAISGHVGKYVRQANYGGDVGLTGSYCSATVSVDRHHAIGAPATSSNTSDCLNTPYSGCDCHIRAVRRLMSYVDYSRQQWLSVFWWFSSFFLIGGVVSSMKGDIWREYVARESVFVVVEVVLGVTSRSNATATGAPTRAFRGSRCYDETRGR